MGIVNVTGGYIVEYGRGDTDIYYLQKFNDDHTVAFAEKMKPSYGSNPNGYSFSIGKRSTGEIITLHWASGNSQVAWSRHPADFSTVTETRLCPQGGMYGRLVVHPDDSFSIFYHDMAVQNNLYWVKYSAANVQQFNINMGAWGPSHKEVLMYVGFVAVLMDASLKIYDPSNGSVVKTLTASQLSHTDSSVVAYSGKGNGSICPAGTASNAFYYASLNGNNLVMQMFDGWNNAAAYWTKTFQVSKGTDTSYSVCDVAYVSDGFIVAVNSSVDNLYKFDINGNFVKSARIEGLIRSNDIMSTTNTGDVVIFAHSTKAATLDRKMRFVVDKDLNPLI